MDPGIITQLEVVLVIEFFSSMYSFRKQSPWTHPAASKNLENRLHIKKG
jgi:hypothetical protein